jgi:Uma2 family endonuclease
MKFLFLVTFEPAAGIIPARRCVFEKERGHQGPWRPLGLPDAQAPSILHLERTPLRINSERSPISTVISTTPLMMPSGPVPPRVRHITVDEYERIILSGALKDHERIELINGYMVDKMAKSPQDGSSTRNVLDALASMIGPSWTWRSEQPIRVPDYDAPEPDVAVVRGTTEDYAYRIPGPQDVGLMVEVSLTTLDQDRGEKGSAYARVGIPVYWFINLASRVSH